MSLITTIALVVGYTILGIIAIPIIMASVCLGICFLMTVIEFFVEWCYDMFEKFCDYVFKELELP